MVHTNHIPTPHTGGYEFAPKNDTRSGHTIATRTATPERAAPTTGRAGQDTEGGAREEEGERILCTAGEGYMAAPAAASAGTTAANGTP